MKKITIAIDGGAGVGKGVTARGVAQALWYSYVDTGAMWRALTLYCLQHNVNCMDEPAVLGVLDQVHITFQYDKQTQNNMVFLNGVCVEDQIRTPEVNAVVSEIALYKPVRKRLVAQQKWLLLEKGVVMEWRDIGTVVAPDAELKIHLVADIDIRARRRQQQLAEKWIEMSLEEIKENLKKRDWNDLYKENSSSTISPDAIEVDTSFITIPEQVDIIVDMAKKIIES